MTTVGSLCTGYGGLDMGLAFGLGTPLRHAWHVEHDKHPAAILAARYREVPNYGDLTTLDHDAMEPVDWLTAGYPCQPFSAAGKRLGVADARHLWPFVADTIGRLRPRNVLLENVRGHLGRGFDSVLADLAALGYDAKWGAVRASDAGAPHARERLFVVATHTTGDRRDERRPEPAGQLGRPDAAEHRPPAPDAGSARLGQHPGATPAEEARTLPGDELADHRGSRAAADWGPYLPAIERWAAIVGRPAPRPTSPRKRCGERLSPAFVEWLMGLPAGWVTQLDIPINAQLRALGNGVVPQQAALALRLLGVTEQEIAA